MSGPLMSIFHLCCRKGGSGDAAIGKEYVMFKLTETDLRDFAEEIDLEAKRATGRNGRGELPRSFFETYSAMANTNGGIIFLGIEEKPKGIFSAVGIPEPEPVLKSLWDNLNNKNQVSVL